MSKESMPRIFEAISEEETKKHIERKLEELEEKKMRNNLLMQLCSAENEVIEKEEAEWKRRFLKLKEE